MTAQRFTVLTATMLLTAWGALAAAAVPGDVNGDGVVAADDVACVAATAFDAGVGCATAIGSLENVITVSPSGGDFEHLDDALASITDSDALNPYVVVLGPGTFFGPVTVPNHVSLVGSGAQATTILQSDPDNTVVENAAVRCLGACTIQDLSIFVQSFAAPGSVATALYLSASATVRSSTLEVHSAVTGYGVFATSASTLDLVDSTIDVRECSTGYGVWSEHVATVRRSSITSRLGDTLNVGLRAGANVLIKDSTVASEGYLASTARGAEVGVVAEIHRSTVQANGGSTANAVKAEGTLTIPAAQWTDNVFFAAGGSMLSSALEVSDGASLMIRDTSFTAVSSPSTWGVATNDSTLHLAQAEINSFGSASDHHAIYQHTTGGFLTLRDSQVYGATSSILNEVASMTRIATSQLSGTIDNAGGASMTCVASWDGGWSPLSSTCN
jgi:hypothetical protein